MSDKPRSGRSDTCSSKLVNRRTFLSGAGAGVVTSLAGCVGGLGGGSGSENTVTIASFPLDVDGVVFDYIDTEGILEEHLSETGWDYEMTLTFEDVPQYVSGNADISGVSELEACQVGVEQGIESSVFGRRANSYWGWLVKTGGEYDPDNTGSVQASLDKVVEEGANVGIGGWGVGNVPSSQIAVSEGYGLEMSEEGGDFSVVTAEIPAISQLIDQGDLAMGTHAPSFGASSYLMEDTLKPLFWELDKIDELGLGLPPLTGLTCRQSFLEENKEVVEAVFDATNEGYTWFYEQGFEDIPENDTWMQKLAAENQEQAEYIINWQKNEDVEYGTEHIPRPKDITFTQDRIGKSQEFLESAEDVGFLPSGWQDYVEMVTL